MALLGAWTSAMLKNLTVEKFGPYTCQAGNGYSKHCTRRSFEIRIQGALIPEIVEGPKNQSVPIGSNVTLSCTAKGLPKPTINWIKVNTSHILQTNPRARVIQDGRTNRSQLLIAGVEMEDYGKYQCIVNNSFGKSQSGVALLNIDVQKPEIVEGPKNQRVSIGSNASFSCTVKGLPRPTIYWIKDNASYHIQSNPRASVIQERNANDIPITQARLQESSTVYIAIAVPVSCAVMTVFINGVLGLWWYMRCKRGKK
ncbi:muscle, skeletal receptor tyrosine-protein kinase-like, partial [Stylophora pistillata]|uniref:muscle, skeletal receptor tyrosine-protein kinase-like n=1 Tax=Stylophora pistillata TaxID=50429 RepID=UPI000C047796